MGPTARMNSVDDSASRFSFVSLYYMGGAVAALAVTSLLGVFSIGLLLKGRHDGLVMVVAVLFVCGMLAFGYLAKRSLVVGKIHDGQLILRSFFSLTGLVMDPARVDRVVMTRRNMARLEGPRWPEDTPFKKAIGAVLRFMWIMTVGSAFFATVRGMIDLVVIFVVAGDSHRHIIVPAPSWLNRRAYLRIVRFWEQQQLAWKADPGLRQELEQMRQSS